MLTGDNQTSDLRFANVDPPDVSVRNLDYTTKGGFYVSQISGDTDENLNTANFTVSLSSAPSDNFTITMASSDDTEGVISAVTGVTGERASLQERVAELVLSLKECDAGPVAVGFGISGADQVRQVREWGADGAIIGSALVKRIAAAQLGCAAADAGEFCRELREAAG